MYIFYRSKLVIQILNDINYKMAAMQTIHAKMLLIHLLNITEYMYAAIGRIARDISQKEMDG